MFFYIFGKALPYYGTLICLGGLLANLIAFLYVRKTKLIFDYLLVIEAYCILGGFLGAKILYLIVSAKEIEWDLMSNLDYLNFIMQSGFVFYGGLIGGVLAALLAGKIHKIEVVNYMKPLIFTVPFIHSFGRMGCYKAGCCYGMEYDGPFSIVYTGDYYFTPLDTPLFPIQIVEAILLMAIAIILFVFTLKKKYDYTLPIYFITYGIVRFSLEYLRGDLVRGIYGLFSTSQWISLGLIITGIVLLIKTRNNSKAIIE